MHMVLITMCYFSSWLSCKLCLFCFFLHIISLIYQILLFRSKHIQRLYIIHPESINEYHLCFFIYRLSSIIFSQKIQLWYSIMIFYILYAMQLQTCIDFIPRLIREIRIKSLSCAISVLSWQIALLKDLCDNTECSFWYPSNDQEMVQFISVSTCIDLLLWQIDCVQ